MKQLNLETVEGRDTKPSPPSPVGCLSDLSPRAVCFASQHNCCLSTINPTNEEKGTHLPAVSPQRLSWCSLRLLMQKVTKVVV